MADDYQQGYQDGWKAATEAVMSNRDLFRKGLGLPDETLAEAIKRIYADVNAPGRGDNCVTQTIDTVADTVDLYVVLPPGLVPTPPPREPKKENDGGG